MLTGILEPLRGLYDYIIVDTCPSLGTLTINALTAADEVIIAVNPQLLAMMGLQDFIRTVKKVRNRLNDRLQIAGILLTMCDARTNLCKVITEQLTDTFDGQIRIFKSIIPNTVKVGESFYYNEPLLKYAPEKKLVKHIRIWLRRWMGMKANAPKRKVFQDALDLLVEDPVKNTPAPVNGNVSIPVEEIHPFHDHPFRLYEGDLLEDMVQSIREYGVSNPVIVRKAARGYEKLAGHNRTNAAKIAGLTEVPAIVKTNLSDEDAYVYVIETNLLQRSFAELLPSEKAAVLVVRYEKISSQGKRNDIRQEIEALEETCGHDVHKSRQRTCGHDVHKSQKSRDGLGKEYGMTGRNIARYMRLDRLIPEFKDAVDNRTLAMVAAVDLSYLNVKMQKLIQQVAESEGKKLKPKQADELRKMGKEITKKRVESVLAGKEQKKAQSISVKLPVELYEKYFAQMYVGTVQEIMEKALETYLGKEVANV